MSCDQWDSYEVRYFHQENVGFLLVCNCAINGYDPVSKLLLGQLFLPFSKFFFVCVSCYCFSSLHQSPSKCRYVTPSRLTVFWRDQSPSMPSVILAASFKVRPVAW